MLAAPRPADGMERIAGYSRLEPAGRGRLALVYRALEEQQQRTVALKVFLLDGLDRAGLRRFRRDCKLTGRLSGHPNVATALDVGTTGSGRLYVAMDYFEGGSLGERLAGHGPLPLEEALRAGVAIAAALGAAHAAGIVHGDVRPRNVLVSGAGEHALADFDVAALAAAADGRLRVLSPGHAAPEVLQGQPPSSASDIFSLGATLYELLAGRPPFDGVEAEDAGALAHRILTEPPPPIDRQEVPPAVEALVGEAMRGPAPERAASAFAFADRLRQVQGELELAVTELPTAWRERRSPSGAEPPSGDGSSGSTEPPVPGGNRRRIQRIPIGAVMPAAERERRARARRARARRPRPPQAEGAPGTSRPGSNRAPTIAAFLVLMLAGLAVELGFHFALGAFQGTTSQHAAQGAAAPRHAPASPAPIATPVPAQVMDDARPARLTALDSAGSVVLHWELQPGNRYPLVVRRLPATGGTPTDTPVSNGSTTTTITGLDRRAGYCFQVGAIVAFGQPSTIAWSAAVCVRGAG